MNKYVGFFLKTQLFVLLVVAVVLTIAVPITVMSMTKSLLPLLLYVPMIGVFATFVRFYDEEDS
jgi:hypothetical protein